MSSKRSDLSGKSKDFVSKFDQVYSELQISRKCYHHLFRRIIHLERNALSNSYYHRKDTIEINHVPKSLGAKFWKRIFATLCPELVLMLLQNSSICHCLKKTAMLLPSLKDKSSELTQLRFFGKAFIGESMSRQNHQLADRYHQSKNAGKIHSNWFFNNKL